MIGRKPSQQVRINHFPTHFALAVPNPHSVQNADFPLEGTEGIWSSPDARILILSSRPPPKWGHSPKSWGNGGNIPLFPGLGECVGMGGMPILPLK